MSPGERMKDGVGVEDIGMVGTTRHGEHIVIEVRTDRGQEVALLIPYGLFQKFLMGLTAAGAKACNEQLERLKTQQTVIDFTGLNGCRPTDYRLGRGVTDAGDDILLMRLCIDRTPMWDVMTGFEQASGFATDILRELRKGPERPEPPN
jgi:hypothetical protein